MNVAVATAATTTPPVAVVSLFADEQTQHKVDAAREYRHAGKRTEAIAAFEEALELEGNSDVIWGELALTQYQVWHDLVTQLHKQGVLKSSHFNWSDAVSSASPLLGTGQLHDAYNSFIVAMEYPANKKNPQLLCKMVMLYLEFHAYPGALSVCTLLVEGYAHSPIVHEAIFLSAISAKALNKHRESAQYFQYLVDKPPFRLQSYQLYLLAALELEKLDGTRDHVREMYAQAYKAMIALSPVSASEKSAHQIYKTSHKNESQRLHMWFQDNATWFDLANKLTNLNFPSLTCLVFEVVRKRGDHLMTKDLLVVEGVCRYRIGNVDRAVDAMAMALQMEYWCTHTRYLLQKISPQWRQQFVLEEESAQAIQRTVRKYWLRQEWRKVASALMEAKRRQAAIVVQCAWRQHDARRQLATLLHARRQRERHENDVMAKEDWQVILQKWNTAAVGIQSLHKIFCAKQEMRLRKALQTKHNRIVASFTVHRSAASAKQMVRKWRQFVDLQKQERWDAACCIQRKVRSHLSRSLYKRLLAAKARQERIVLGCLDRRAATVTRRAMRDWQHYTLGQRELKAAAARRIQRVWRCFVARKRYHHELRRHVVATELMHRMLADKTAQSLRTAWNAIASNAVWHRMQKRRAAVAIQRHARGMIARRRVRKLRSRRRRVEIVVQAMRTRSSKQLMRLVFDGMLSFVEMQWELRHTSATAVQRIFRGYAARKRVRFLKECNRILNDPTVSLRGKPNAYVVRVCFLLLARLPEQNRLNRARSSCKIQKWYRQCRKRRRLVVALAKLHRQRAILNTLQVNFKGMAVLFFNELKKRVHARRWNRNRMARRIQRVVKKWLVYRRYRRMLHKRESRKARAAHHARQKQLALLVRCIHEWHRVVCHEKQSQLAAVLCIQRAYRARIAKKQARRLLCKRAARAHVIESMHLKPLERCFKRWEACLMEKHVLAVRGAAHRTMSNAAGSNGSDMGLPDKWKFAMKKETTNLMPQAAVATLEQRAELPSLLFYTLLSRVRQSGILQLSLAGGFSCITISQLQQLLAFASSIIVDGGGGGGSTGGFQLVEHVIDAMASSDRPYPAQKLIFCNAKLSAAHAVSLHTVLRRPGNTVTSVVLSNIQMSSAGVTALATSLCHGHSKLEQLVLEACAIGSVGAAAIAEALCHNKHLWKLDLSQNHIGDSACGAIAQALVANGSLRVFSLSANAISDRGVLGFLAPTLERVMGDASSRLESVVLRQNPRISPLGRHALQQHATNRCGGLVAVHLD